MSKYGTGMRSCCDSLLRGNHPHIIGCEQHTPQDSQTLTADESLRKSALDFVDWIIWHKSGILNGMTSREVNDFTEELGKFRAALNQGQG